MRIPELLAPAGDLEKLKTAVFFGADAVYFGARSFSLRQGAGNFTVPEIREGVQYAHAHGARCYLALNIYAHHEDLAPLRGLLREIRDIPVDAFLVSDPGVMRILKEERPNACLHLSTQANLTNFEAALFWRDFGVRRIVLARELSMQEIREIREHVPEDLELEVFVHGAMCMSYSGRCLLSAFLTGRDANRGACAHPCRYRYVLEEERRPGEYFPVEEDEQGTYILNSKDLCLIRRIPELAKAGVSSLKIEGRGKSAFYCATVVHAYRQALDAWARDPQNWVFEEAWMTELEKASHRTFSEGFFTGNGAGSVSGAGLQNYETTEYIAPYVFCGRVLSYDEASRTAVVEERNKIRTGDEVEYFGPDLPFFRQRITEIRDEETGALLSEAPHPLQRIRIPADQEVRPGYLLRMRRESRE